MKNFYINVKYKIQAEFTTILIPTFQIKIVQFHSYTNIFQFYRKSMVYAMSLSFKSMYLYPISVKKTCQIEKKINKIT